MSQTNQQPVLLAVKRAAVLALRADGESELHAILLAAPAAFMWCGTGASLRHGL